MTRNNFCKIYIESLETTKMVYLSTGWPVAMVEVKTESNCSMMHLSCGETVGRLQVVMCSLLGAGRAAP